MAIQYVKIVMTRTKTENNVLTEQEEKEISQEQYNNITNDATLRWFRRLGGSETARRGYTCDGYKIVKLISRSPDKITKVVREFSFTWIN